LDKADCDIMADSNTQTSKAAPSTAVYWKTRLNEFLHRPGKLADILHIAEEKTGQDRSLLVGAGVVAVLALVAVGGPLGVLVCSTARVTYPVYSTVVAVQQNNAVEKDRWMQFWVVENLFLFVDHFAPFLAMVVPLYWLLRLTLMLWLMAPVTSNGSRVLYTLVVKRIYNSCQDYFNKVEEVIINKDKVVDEVTPPAGEFEVRDNSIPVM